MQKKIIALAIAGLASSAAFAQTNVTIYGSMDYGYAYRNDARKPFNANRGTADSASTIDGGQSAGNRIGFKGTEDLGNGLKAVFLIEQGFVGDTGASAGNSNTAGAATNTTASAGFTRQAYMGLAGNFGTLIGGRLYTPHWSLWSSVDPFGAGTVGQFVNVYGGDVNALLQPVRVDNAIAYVTPSFGGFNVTAAYSNNAVGADSRVDNSQNNTVYAVLARYTAGPVDAGVNYHLIQAASTGTPPAPGAQSLKNIQNLSVAGVFDAKVLKVHAGYSWNLMDNTLANTDVKLNNYMLGLSAPLGKATLKASYMLSDGNYAAGGNAQQYAVGADYSLSKRTNLYAAYALIDNDSEVKNGVRVSRGAATNDASNSGFTATGGIAYQQGFQIGVRHQF